MKVFSTTKAAEKLGMHRVNLQNAIRQGKVIAPKLSKVGGVSVRLWTNSDIDRARKAMTTTRKKKNAH
jgi:plasmid maintenance system antidote protein VapI